MNTTNQRDTNLDLLRVLAAFAVVWLHVSAGVVATKPDVYSEIWWIGNFADSFSRWSVPIFVMVSGALLLSKSSELAPLDFYQKRASRLLAPITFWTLFYVAFYVSTTKQFDIYGTVKDCRR
jgi:surface polysaccharide O-acyltransferase-like enzyme